MCAGVVFGNAARSGRAASASSNRAVRARAVADGDAAVAAGGNPVLHVQIEFPVLGLGVEPGLTAEPRVVLLCDPPGPCPRVRWPSRLPSGRTLHLQSPRGSQPSRVLPSNSGRQPRSGGQRDLSGGRPLGAARQQRLEVTRRPDWGSIRPSRCAPAWWCRRARGRIAAPSPSARPGARLRRRRRSGCRGPAPDRAGRASTARRDAPSGRAGRA